MERINELYTKIIEEISGVLCTSTAVMAPYPTGSTERVPIKGTKQKYEKGEKPVSTKKAVVEAFAGDTQRKGSEKKAQLGYKYQKLRRKESTSINEKIEEIEKICDAILEECNGDNQEQNPRDAFRKFMEMRNMYSELAKKNPKKVGTYLDRLKLAGKEYSALRQNREESKAHKESVEENFKNDPEYTIPMGNKKRVQNNINRYNREAKKGNPELRKNQKEAIVAWVNLMKKKNKRVKGAPEGGLTPEEQEALQVMKGSAPASNYDGTKGKYQNAITQKRKYSEMARRIKDKYN